MKNVFFLLAILSFFSIAVLYPTSQCHSSDLEVKFSESGINLLKKIQRLESDASIAKGLLFSAIIIDLITSKSIIDMIVSISKTDFSEHAKAIIGMKKIFAARAYNEIFGWYNQDDIERTTSEEKFFLELAEQFSKHL